MRSKFIFKSMIVIKSKELMHTAIILGELSLTPEGREQVVFNIHVHTLIIKSINIQVCINNLPLLGTIFIIQNS